MGERICRCLLAEMEDGRPLYEIIREDLATLPPEALADAPVYAERLEICRARAAEKRHLRPVRLLRRGAGGEEKPEMPGRAGKVVTFRCQFLPLFFARRMCYTYAEPQGVSEKFPETLFQIRPIKNVF